MVGDDEGFPSPHSGILFLSERKVILCYQNSNCFRPLIRGFFFYNSSKLEKAVCFLFPSPHSGILFLCCGDFGERYTVNVVSVPSFGDSFFIKSYRGIEIPDKPDVSVPSFGDSFFMETVSSWKPSDKLSCFRPLIRGFFFYTAVAMTSHSWNMRSFRPLIRGFFFYKCIMKYKNYIFNTFPSPHSGILFLFGECKANVMRFAFVSVPSFGDSFFILSL